MHTPGLPEIVFIAILALLIFGPDKLPEVARGAGRMISQFRREASGAIDELKRSADYDDLKGVADEFRSTTTDLKRSMTLSGATAMGAQPARPGGADGPARDDVAPPFDPEAT